MFSTGVPMTEATIDQTGHRSDPQRMSPPMMPIHLRQRLVVSQPSDAMLHHDASPRERPIIIQVRLRTRLAPRLAARSRPQSVGMQLVNAHIGQVTESADAGRQPVQDPRPFQQLEVPRRPWHALRDIHDLTRRLVHGDLALECMLLLLAAIQSVGGSSLPWPLHPLLEGIDDNGQVRGRLQQAIQLLSLRLTGIGHPHSIASRRLQDGHESIDQTRHGRIADAEEKSQYLVDRITTQPDANGRLGVGIRLNWTCRINSCSLEIGLLRLTTDY